MLALDSLRQITHERLRPVAAVILLRAPHEGVAGEARLLHHRTPASFMMSNAIGLILLVCTLLLYCVARLPLCRPDCFVNKPITYGSAGSPPVTDCSLTGKHYWEDTLENMLEKEHHFSNKWRGGPW